MKIWLVDTGPLIALLEEAEKDHAWVVEALRSAPLPLLTCDAVLTEACFLLKRQHRDPNDLLIMAETVSFASPLISIVNRLPFATSWPAMPICPCLLPMPVLSA